MNYAIFTLNSLGALLLLFGCTVSVVGPFLGQGQESPFAFVGGIMFAPVLVMVLVLEWRGVVRKKHECLKALGVLQLTVFVFLIFAFITNTYEARQDWGPESKSFVIVFGSVCGILAVYNALSGLCRIRLYKKLKHVKREELVPAGTKS